MAIALRCGTDEPIYQLDKGKIMNKTLVSYGWFLVFMVATNLVVAPIVRKVTPKDASGLPLINLL